MTPDTISSDVNPLATIRRSIRLVRCATTRLVNTAKTPEIEMACPVCPSVIARSLATRGSRLTGMNSEATKTKAASAIEKTAPQAPAMQTVFSS